MKKYLSLFSLSIITLMLLSFSACDSTGNITTSGSAPITMTITKTITQIITVTAERPLSSVSGIEGRKDAEIELANVQTAVVASMADAVVAAVAAPGLFGNTQ